MTPDEKRAKIRECLRRRKASLKKQGLCQDCGRRPREHDRTLCWYCLAARRRRSSAKYHRIEDPEAVEKMMQLTGR